MFTTVRALHYKLPPRDTLTTACRTFKIGDEVEFVDIMTFLIRSGYRQVELVEVKGEFAHRGDIIDIFPLTEDTPVRLDFFGDELDEIRLFDPTSQVTIEHANFVVITPMTETCLADISMSHWKSQTEELMKESPKSPEYINAIREMTHGIENYIARTQTLNPNVDDEILQEIDGVEAFSTNVISRN